MKKISPLFYLLVISFIVMSCSSDDGGGDTETPPTSPVLGTWQLVALNINPQQDIDGDGTPTRNILTELPCATGTITITADGWTSNTRNLSITAITNDLFIIDCADSSQSTSGDWLLQNNQLTLFQETSAVIFTLSGEDTLTNTSNEDLPGFVSEVYEKQ